MELVLTKKEVENMLLEAANREWHDIFVSAIIECCDMVEFRCVLKSNNMTDGKDAQP
jgi:hypothetical protein